MEYDFIEVDSIDKVPEMYRGLYVQKDGKFVVTDSAKPLAEAYVGLNKTYKETDKQKKTANDESAARRVELKTYEELAAAFGLEAKDGKKIADVLKGHIEELTAKSKNGEEVKVNMDKIKQQYENAKNEALTAKDGEVTKMRGSLEKYLVSQAATAALATHKGAVELLLPIVKENVKVVQEGEDFVVRVVDSAGDVRSNGKGGWLSVEEFIVEMKSNEKYARAFESETKGGGGKPPANTKTNVRANTTEMSSVDKIGSGLKNLRNAR